MYDDPKEIKNIPCTTKLNYYEKQRLDRAIERNGGQRATLLRSLLIEFFEKDEAASEYEAEDEG